MLEDKTYTDILQKWHIPGERMNEDPIKLSELTFFKADITKDQQGSRKHLLVSDSQDFCATRPFAYEPLQENLNTLHSELY